MRYTMRQKTEAVKLVREVGSWQAAKELHIPASTLSRWNGNLDILRAAGIVELPPEVIAEALDTWKSSLDSRLALLERKIGEQQRTIKEIRKLLERAGKDPKKQSTKEWIDSLIRDYT